MTGFSFSLSCPKCGSEIEQTASGRRYSWQTAAAVRCTTCPWSGAVSVTVFETRAERGTTRRQKDLCHAG